MISERRLQGDVEGLLRQLEDRGVLWHHCADPRYCHGPRGFPDVWAAGPGWDRFLAYELKREIDDATAEQQAWLWTLTEAVRGRGVIGVRKPSDLASGLIQTELGLLAG